MYLYIGTSHDGMTNYKADRLSAVKIRQVRYFSRIKHTMQFSDYKFYNKFLPCNLTERKFDINTLKIEIIFVNTEFLCNSVIKTRQLMLYKERVAVCSEVRNNHRNTIREQNVKSVDI